MKGTKMGQMEMNTQSVTDRLLEKDIARSDSEMLLFMTVFGTESIRQMAKRELSQRTGRFDDDYDYSHAFDREINIVAAC
jgi:hypothetical protein